MSYTLEQAAKRLGLTRPELIRRMREKGLLTDKRLPAQPVRDRLYLRVKEGSWQHPTCGTQYSYSTRVREAGLRWLEEQLGIERPLPPPEPDRRDVA